MTGPVTRTEHRATDRGTARRATALLAGLACVAAGCGDSPAPYRWPEGAAASLEVRVREELLPARSAREVRIAASGRVERPGELVLRVAAVRHQRFRDGASVGVADTETVAARPETTSREDAAFAAVAESLLGCMLHASFDPSDGLRALGGPADALAPTRPTADVEAAAAGLRGILSDASLLHGLRGAGLCAIPENFRDRAAAVSRRVSVAAPGRGLLTFRLSGEVGFDTDGAPIVRCSGRARASDATTGPPGEAPPEAVGPVLLEHVEADAETLHDPVSHVPLRGTFTTRVPFRSGATVVTTTSFLLTVHP